MEQNRFWILAAKKISGELTGDEARELELLLLSDSNNRDILASLQSPVFPNSTSANFNKEELLQRLRVKMAAASKDYNIPLQQENELTQPELKPFPKRFSTRWKLIAVALLLIITGFVSRNLFFVKHDNTTALKSTNNISTKPGSKSQITLPDGTLVTLNADSKLTYPNDFLGNTREVNLEGEAFFEVTHNADKPFIVHTKLMDIRVLGTVFNVRSYADDNVSEASLLKGSIQVTIKNRKDEKVMLVPNEKISVSNNIAVEDKDSSVATKAPDTSGVPSMAIDKINYDSKDAIINEVAWMQNKLVFNNESFEKIIVVLERWYGKQITIKDPKLKTQRFTGKFKNETIEQVLKAFQLTYNFKYKTENNSIIIY